MGREETATAELMCSTQRLETPAERVIVSRRGQGASRPREGNLPPEPKSRRGMTTLFPPVSWTPGK
jgi:hypothetical protein